MSQVMKDQTMSSSKRAVVLLSGGLDSATCLAIAKAQGFVPYAMSFRYGQRHEGELARAQDQARLQGVAEHIVVKIDLGVFGGSALTDATLAVPKHTSPDEIGNTIPITYVPARNTVFLSFALGWAEVLGSRDIFIGVNALDYSGYPDCRPEYITAYQKMANLATKASVSGDTELTIHTPLIHLSKAEIIQRGLELGVDYSKTLSCYDPTTEGEACGHCDACLLRLRGFEQNQQLDPALYVSRS